MKTVAICASKRHILELNKFCQELRRLGVVIFEPNFKEPVYESAFIKSKHITKSIFKGLTLEHFDWIRKADACFIFNYGGYVGVSVSLEIGFASALGKPIYALLDKTGDPCRDTLIDKIAPTPKSLYQLLK